MADEVINKLERMKLTVEEEEVIEISEEDRLADIMSCYLSLIDPNLFQFKFNTEFDMMRIFKRGPWTFDNQLLMLQRWQKGKTASNMKWDKASLWVQIWDASFDMVSPTIASKIGGRLKETMGYTVGSNSSMNDFQSSAITVDCWGMIFTTVQVTSSRRKGEKKWSTNMANGSKQ
nr:hypothetical protein CFP56_15694 [Quercus suber]